MLREIPYCLSTTLMGTLFECIALHLYANGTITNYFTDTFESRRTIILSVLWIIFMPIWRDTHFYIIHRGMHPWNTKWVPDIGHYIFKYGHSVHHDSVNFTAFSGISMHPIEGFIYETACLVPCLFYHHPVWIWLVKLDLCWKAVVVHDGYDFPGASTWEHYIHHLKFNCNYGSSNAPFDWLFGSFDDGKKEWIEYEAKRKKMVKME